MHSFSEELTKKMMWRETRCALLINDEGEKHLLMGW